MIGECFCVKEFTTQGKLISTGGSPYRQYTFVEGKKYSYEGGSFEVGSAFYYAFFVGTNAYDSMIVRVNSKNFNEYFADIETHRDIQIDKII